MTSRERSTLISVNALGIRFGGLTALHDVSFQVHEHEIVSVIGPNGAGKTTLFNIVTGVYESTSGTVRCMGKDPAKPFSGKTALALLASTIGAALFLFTAYNIEGIWASLISANYVYQQPFPWGSILSSFVTFWQTLSWGSSAGVLLLGGLVGLSASWKLWSGSRLAPEVIVSRGLSRTFQNIRIFPRMSVLENILAGMHDSLRSTVIEDLFTLPRARSEQRRAERRAREILSLVDLSDLESIAANKLSYGHQRRLEIARALATNPRLLLLDEPAAGMNPSESHELMEIIRRIREQGISVLLIEHHMHVVMGISDRIVVLDYGEKIAEGTPAEIRANKDVIEAYLGGEGTL